MYVFEDKGHVGSQMIVRVVSSSSSCINEVDYQVLPSTNHYLTKLGVTKSAVSADLRGGSYFNNFAEEEN